MDNKDYLNGRKLCEKLNVAMYQQILIQRKSSQQIFGDSHGKYFISPLGLAVQCSDGVGLFEVVLGKELLDGQCTIYFRFNNFINHKKVIFNKEWVHRLELEANIRVRVKDSGTVSTMNVPAVRFKKRQYRDGGLC